MTSPDGQLRADLDQMQSAGNRWSVMTEDLNPGPPPSPGTDPTDPTTLATATIHATTQLTTAQLQALLGDYGKHTSNSATAMGEQERMSASSIKDLMGMLTSGAKDVGGIATNIGQVGTQMATTLGQGATQAGTTAMTAAMTAATTGAKTNAPGGAVAGGLTDPSNINHDKATTTDGSKDNGRDHSKPTESVHR